LKNIGTCTWTTSYSAVFTSGNQLGAPAVVNLPWSVSPGATVDISVNLTAPSTPGHYRGNWELRNASSGLFGVGASANSIFWVDIYVNGSYTTSTAYDFVANYCSAAWSSGAGALPCPGTDGDSRGFVLNVSAPQLENGSVDANPGLVVNPQQVTGGYIQGVYPAYTVQSGDHFQGIINCAYNAPNCYVNFRLMYQIGSGSVHTFWSFNERYEGLYYRFNLDLSSLAGQSVHFILYTADVSGHGSPSGDRAEWVETKIASYSSGPYTPIPPSITCNRGYFVTDVTIPDGSVLAPGASFTKTWEIRNVGSCTWTTSYALVYVFGNLLGATPVINLPTAVAPGVTADFSVNMVAPNVAGHYRSYWRFRDASGVQFGVGSGMITFFADIYVSTSGLTSSTTTITAHSPNPSTPGQSVAVNVTVSGSGTTPTGTVAITGADSNCTLTLSGGSGSCNVVFNTTGAKILTATYSGNTTYAGSSGTASHNVSTATASSTTSITADTPDPSTPGQAVAVSVTVSGTGTTPTGTVAITGADANCTLTLASGSGSCNVSFNTTGTKTLTATYNGDLNYAGSSGTASHTVSKGSTTTAITADTPDPSTTGQAVTVSVTVSGAGVNPTGTVAITGADTNCTITLSSGSGSCNTVVFNTAGAKTLTATYSGDGNYTGSSGTASHTVNTAKAATGTTITSDTPDPSLPGQAVVVNVTVSGAGMPKPSGTVNITGADGNCNILLLADGTGSCSVTFNTTGHKTLTAAYNGDGNYAASSGTASHTVIKASTTTTITADNPDPSMPTHAITVSVKVDGSGVTPTGTVDISGADINCTITLAGGTGSCNNVVFNTIGDKTLTATYNGDGNYLTSSGTAAHVVKNASTTTVTAVPDSTTPGSLPANFVTVTVKVSGSGVTPTGTVDVTGTDHNIAGAVLDGTGTTTMNVWFLTAGAKIITATYSGDVNYVGSSGSAAHTVVRGTPTVYISAVAPEPSAPNQLVQVTVTVTGDGVNPTGFVGISISGGEPSTCTITLVGGTGSCNVTITKTGTFTITATYSGDGNYLGNTDHYVHTVS
jgi:hypothetical protein